MQARQTPLYDILILGASSITGRYVVREALKFINAPSSPLKSLALAGRSANKLAQTLQWAAYPGPPPPIPILIADISDSPSLHRLCSQTKLVFNCTNSGCDYLDICGEPEFLERMGAEYHEQWKSPAVPNRVNSYVSLESDKRIVGNFGTYESAVLGVANEQKLRETRRSMAKRARPVLPTTDASVVRRTLSVLTENPRGIPGANESSEEKQKREAFWSTVKPAHFGVKIGAKSFLGVYRFIIVGRLIGFLCRGAVGGWFVFTFPSLFTLGYFKKKGPSEDEVKIAAFKMWFVGHGFSDNNLVSKGDSKPDMEIITRVTGSEIGYVTTLIILVQCALILLSQRKNLPNGGVFPPGIVFGATDLQRRLQEKRISFDVISQRQQQNGKSFDLISKSAL